MAVAERNRSLLNAASLKSAPQQAIRVYAGVNRPEKRATVQLTWIIVLFGVLLRVYHFLSDPSMWHDEAALVVNALGKYFGELLGPLSYSEAAPPLFLWIERAVYLCLGDSTLALRSFPALASAIALFLFVGVARRVLEPAVVPFAVLFMSCSERLLWHGCEAKPYSSDCFVAVALAALYCGTQIWRFDRRCLAFAVPAPAMIFLAYPACFLYGGILAALAVNLTRERRLRSWVAYALLSTTVVAAFALLLLGPINAQRCEPMDQCWEDAFPPWSYPWEIPTWTVRSILGVFDYCCRPVGALLIWPAVVGSARLWTRGHKAFTLLLVVPLGLAFLASCGHAYPFTGARVLAYNSPAVFLLAAEGILPCARWLRDRMRRQAWYARGLPAVAERRRTSDGIDYLSFRMRTDPRSVLGRLTFCTDRIAFFILTAALVLPLAWSLYRTCVPWVRADFRAATAYIEAHHRPQDRVVWNSWEGDYYFRKWSNSRDDASRCWVVVAGKVAAEERLGLARELTTCDWPIIARRDFPGISVLLLKRDAEIMNDEFRMTNDERMPNDETRMSNW